MKEKLVILTGAGISAESGINTFRGSDGLWEGHRVEDVASMEGWLKNKQLVLDFYNTRRRELKKVSPNAAHISLTKIQSFYDVTIITQNVDDLHERAGNKNVIHLHGELKKARSLGNLKYIIDWQDDITENDVCPDGFPMRPHIVWFGEEVPMIEYAIEKIYDAHHVWIIGTSMKVYPAAGLVRYAPRNARKFYIDPYPSINHELSLLDVNIIEDTAVNSVPKLVEEYIAKVRK